MTRPPQERALVAGPAGTIETAIEHPAVFPADGVSEGVRGIALVCHPHPLFGGTMDNKVVTTLARAFVELGCVALRPNFRGVGASEGAHDHGEGETEDMLAVIGYARERFGEAPLALAGFSFGGYVQTRVAQRAPPERMVLVGVAAGDLGERSYDTPDAPAGTLVIHGELDETVPLARVLDWARPQDLPVVVIPGADHFFHRRLHHIRDQVKRAWH
ncbi:MAG: alpha/beta fold hydrolase [Burkholderiales bacterium]|nr:alpha/beta fold hydrolase [Burkholderiales bacterium]